jgi:phosphate transport system protein
MVKKFHDELKKLNKQVIEMGHLARGSLSDSVKSLKNQDVELAKKVLCNKTVIADMDSLIEEKALILLTLHQPMAKDLRRIASLLKIITYLNRIGRYAKDIAKITVELSGKPPIKKLVSIPYMANTVCQMIDDTLKSFENEDLKYIENFSDRDDSVDVLRYSIFRECLTYMMEDSKTITPCTNYVMVARYLERCADHACKIAEKIHYMVTGDHIEIDPSAKKNSESCKTK